MDEYEARRWAVAQAGTWMVALRCEATLQDCEQLATRLLRFVETGTFDHSPTLAEMKTWT